jgi:hypothetical protein
MTKHLTRREMAHHLFDLLEGTWIGQGHGYFPTISPFAYHETLIFKRRDENTLFYEQQTEKQLAGQTTFLPSHWESGFLRLLESSELELIDLQSGGRSEVLRGSIEIAGELVKVSFVSQGIMNDEKVVASERRWEIEAESLRYEMEMQTRSVEEMSPHLAASLERVS